MFVRVVIVDRKSVSVLFGLKSTKGICLFTCLSCIHWSTYMSNNATQSLDNRKRHRVSDSANMESKTDTFSPKDKIEEFQIRDIFQGITSTQNALLGFMLRMDAQGWHLDELKNVIRGKHGMQEQVELVQEQANDTLYTVTKLGSNQEKMLWELSRLRDYVIKLEFRVNSQEKQILELKARSH